MPERDTVALGACVVSFLIGSVPFGLLIARFFKVADLTERGSGNIGATNVTRILGFWPAGFLTFGFDMLKGILPVLLMSSGWSREFLADHFPAAGNGAWEFTELAIWASALCAVLGHCFSPWLQFKGGKGVATGFGAILVLSPISALIGLAAFAICFFTSRKSSLASLTGLFVAAIAHVIINPMGSHLWAGAAIVLVILLRHEENLDALLQDREKTFG